MKQIVTHIEKWKEHSAYQIHVSEKQVYLGSATLSIQDGMCFIQGLYVAEHCRREGIGNLLLQTIVDYYEFNKFEQPLYLTTWQEDQFIVEWYQRHQFEIITFKKRTPGYKDFLRGLLWLEYVKDEEKINLRNQVNEEFIRFIETIDVNV